MHNHKRITHGNSEKGQTYRNKTKTKSKQSLEKETDSNRTNGSIFNLLME